MKRLLFYFLLFSSFVASAQEQTISSWGIKADHYKAANGIGVGIRPASFDSAGNIIPGSFVSGSGKVDSVTFSSSNTTDTVKYWVSGSSFIAGYVDRSDGLISGGIVTWSGAGLSFDVTGAIYYINGTRYTSNAGSITLNTADATNPRIDVIALDNTGAIVKITGVASSSPSEPQINQATQLYLTSVYVAAGATAPPANVTSTIVYDENVEWAATTSGTIAANFNGTTNSFHGSKNTTVTSWSNGSQIIYINSGTITVSGTNTLKAFIRLSNSLTSGQNIFAQLYNGANAVSGTVNLSSYGLNRSSVGAYQNVSVPFNAFKLKSNTFDRVVFGFSGSNGNIVNLDYVQVQGGITTSTNNTVDSSIYATHNWTISNFQPIGNYLTSQVNSDWNASSGAALILNKPDLSGYLTKAIADGYYQVKLALTAGRIPYTDASGNLTTSPNLTYNAGTGVLTFNVSTASESGISVTNTNTGTTGGFVQVGNNVGNFGGIEMGSTTFGVPSAANELQLFSHTGIRYYTNSNLTTGGTDGYMWFVNGTNSNAAMALNRYKHLIIGDSTDPHPTDPLPFLAVHKIYTDSIVNSSGIVIGGGTGTSYTDFKEEKANVSGTTITLAHTPAFPASVLLFYNDGNSTQIQRQQWYSVSGTTLTLTFTPTASNYFIIKYSY